MSAATHHSTFNSTSRARGGNRGRGWSARNPRNAPGRRHGKDTKTSVPQSSKEGDDSTDEAAHATVAMGVEPVESTAADDASVCWICAEPVKYYAISECGHRTCHVCTLRLRALYKKMECTFCKVSPPNTVTISLARDLLMHVRPHNLWLSSPRLPILPSRSSRPTVFPTRTPSYRYSSRPRI